MASTTLIAKPTFFFLQSNLLRRKPNPLLVNFPNRFQPWFLRSHKLPLLNLKVVNDSKPSTLNIRLKHPIITKNPELANLILIRECDDANNTDDDDDVVVVDMSSSTQIQEEKNQSRNLDQIVVSQALRNPAVAAAVLLVALIMLFIYDPESALAASGGRMGGRSFSRSSSSRSSSHSSSKSSHSSSSKSSRSHSSSSSSSSPHPIRRRHHHRSHPPANLSRFPSSLLEEEDSSRFSCSQVVDAGGYTGGAYSWDDDWAAIFLVAWMLFLVVLGKRLCFKVPKLQNARKIVATKRTSVLKLQVGLLGSRRSLQRDLNQIAETADTSTPKGLSYILTETILALLRYPDYWSSAFSSADVKDNTDEGETRFNELSIEERAKLDEETLVNVDSMKKRSSTIKRTSGVSNEYIVVTILVAAEGKHTIPTINCGSDLKEALQKLASIGSNETLAVEVLWTPQNEDDVLSEQELLRHYSVLRPL